MGYWVISYKTYTLPSPSYTLKPGDGNTNEMTTRISVWSTQVTLVTSDTRNDVSLWWWNYTSVMTPNMRPTRVCACLCVCVSTGEAKPFPCYTLTSTPTITCMRRTFQRTPIRIWKVFGICNVGHVLSQVWVYKIV